jgi:lysophospholipase L1-like esterase
VISGTDEQKIKDCMDYKRKMFDTFHTELPEAKFVVMSGLLLPGRSEYTALTQEINRELEALCAERDYMFFVDASAMTYDGNRFRTELFISDGIHLNHEGQLLWAENYILPQLTALWEE